MELGTQPQVYSPLEGSRHGDLSTECGEEDVSELSGAAPLRPRLPQLHIAAIAISALCAVGFVIWRVFPAGSVWQKEAFLGPDAANDRVQLSSSHSLGSSHDDTPSGFVKMRGYDCWEACKGPGDCQWCGYGNACCRKGAAQDPPECAGITDFWTEHHECVRPVSAVPVKHLGQDCLKHRCKVSGDCAWCGAGNACCMKGNSEDAAECQGITEWPTETQYTCVAPVNEVAVKHEGQNCFDFCRGSGYCDWCGHGNMCCKYGAIDDQPECRAVLFFAQRDHHTCVAPSFPKPQSFPPLELAGPPPSHCPMGQVAGKSSCEKPEHAVPLVFYMYRAVGDLETPSENVNAASLGGILWFLHNEVVSTCPRKFGITRIQRLKVTMKATEALYRIPPHAFFGPYAAFEDARCTAPNCKGAFQEYGYGVGCQPLSTAVAKYVTKPAASLYSLPGPCPTEGSGSKSAECVDQQRGGLCTSVSGEPNCTFSVEEAGFVTLDELEGRQQGGTHEDWCRAGNLEYDKHSDTGVGTSFWQGMHDEFKCKDRMDKLRFLFRTKYPREPDTLGEPACDWWR